MADPAYEAMSKAKRQRDSGNVKGAVDTLEAYLATDPHNIPPRMLLADIIIHDLGDMRYGLMQLDAVLDIEPENVDAMKALVTVLAQNKKDNKESDELFRKIIALQPSAEIYNEYAKFLRHQMTDFKRSAEFYEKAIACDPKKYEYHLNYSVLLLNDIKDWQKAKDELEILLEMRPGDLNVRRNYDRLLEKKFDKNGNPKKGLFGRRRRCSAPYPPSYASAGN